MNVVFAWTPRLLTIALLSYQHFCMDKNLGHPIVIINSLCDAFVRFLASPAKTILNTSIRDRCRIQGIEHFLMQAQFRWSGHLKRMKTMESQKRSSTANLNLANVHVVDKGSIIRMSLSLHSSCAIPVATWEHQATNRSAWCNICHKGLDHFEWWETCYQETAEARKENLPTSTSTRNSLHLRYLQSTLWVPRWTTQPSHNIQC